MLLNKYGQIWADEVRWAFYHFSLKMAHHGIYGGDFFILVMRIIYGRFAGTFLYLCYPCCVKSKLVKSVKIAYSGAPFSKPGPTFFSEQT